jgi:hypothetical protein
MEVTGHVNRRRTVQGFLGVVVGAGFLLSSTVAFAEPYPVCNRTVTTNESDQAHTKYIAGKADYDEGNYESAIRRFRDAYNLDCTKHELLVIMSAAYERNGDKKEAAAALEAYVARAPNAPDVPTYNAKIENLKRQMAVQSEKVQEHTIYPWIVVGVGVVGFGVGVVLLVTAPSYPANCHPDRQQCDTADASQLSQAGRAKDQPVVGAITMGAGAVVAAGGLVWHFLEPTGPKDNSPHARVRPLLSPGVAGLSVAGTF